MSIGVGVGTPKAMVTEYKVLDKGYVRYIDHMGSDERVVFAARRSTNGSSKKNRKDEDLIDYLVRNGHYSPLQHCKVTLEIKMPIFIIRQMMRHSNDHSELSMRYAGDAPREFYVPTQERVAMSGMTCKVFDEYEVSEWVEQVYTDLDVDYKWLTEHGMASELARMELPVSMYTNVLVTGDLRTLLFMLKQRLDKHAQWEIQQYAEVIGLILKDLFPVTWAAFVEHVFRAITFSYNEWETLVKYLPANLLAQLEQDMQDKRRARILIEKIKEGV